MRVGRGSVQSLGWEDPLEKEMATHSSTLAWKIPWMEETGRLQSMGLRRVRHNWANSLSLSVQFSHSVVSNSLWLQGMQHARLPCPSPTTRAITNSFQSRWWCYPTISSSVLPFSSCPQSFPTSWSFPMNQFFASGGYSTEVSASAPVLRMTIQDWFHLDELAGYPCNPRTLNSLLQHHSLKASILQCSGFFIVQLSHPYMTTGKP